MSDTCAQKGYLAFNLFIKNPSPDYSTLIDPLFPNVFETAISSLNQAANNVSVPPVESARARMDG